MASKSQIQRSVEKKLAALLKLKPGSPPDKGELQVLNIAVKYMAVAAKLDEKDWGEDLSALAKENDEEEDELESAEDN